MLCRKNRWEHLNVTSFPPGLPSSCRVVPLGQWTLQTAIWGKACGPSSPSSAWAVAGPPPTPTQNTQCQNQIRHSASRVHDVGRFYLVTFAFKSNVIKQSAQSWKSSVWDQSEENIQNGINCTAMPTNSFRVLNCAFKCRTLKSLVWVVASSPFFSWQQGPRPVWKHHHLLHLHDSLTHQS